MPSYKCERDLAVSILRKTAEEENICCGCAAADGAMCRHWDRGNMICAECGECICAGCQDKSHWTWAGLTAQNMAKAVCSQDCAQGETIAWTMDSKTYEAIMSKDKDELQAYIARVWELGYQFGSKVAAKTDRV